jgi:hypothetical protein
VEKTALPGKYCPYPPIYAPIRIETQTIELTGSEHSGRDSWRLWSKILTGMKGVNLGPIIYTMI